LTGISKTKPDKALRTSNLKNIFGIETLAFDSQYNKTLNVSDNYFQCISRIIAFLYELKKEETFFLNPE
jgi:hypothetical protein